MIFSNSEKRKRKSKIPAEQKLSNINLQEPQFKAMLQNREKVDGLELFQGNKSWEKEHLANIGGQREEKHSLSKSTCNMRKSLAWDNAFFTSPGVLEPDELKTLNLIIDDETDMPKVPEFLFCESEGTRKHSECNYRVSLAWDNAFFTSPGVLDPEELSLINEGCEKSELHPVSGIDKKLFGLTEPDLTDDDNDAVFSLKGLEISLFEHVKSSNGSSSRLDEKSSSCKAQKETASIRMDVSSRSRVKPRPAPARKSFCLRRFKRTTNKASVHAYEGEFGRNREHGSSLKPPTAQSKANQDSAAPSEGASLHAHYVKMESDKTHSDRVVCESLSALPSECQCSRSLAATSKPTILLFSNHKASSAACGINNEPHSDSLRKFHGSKKVKDSVLRNSWCHMRRNEAKRGHPNKVLMPNSSSPASLADSVYSSSDGWFPESLVTSADQGSCKSRANPDTDLYDRVTSVGKSSHISDMVNSPRKQPPRGTGIQQVILSDHCVKKVEMTASPVPTAPSGHLKPSGLRMPSPIIRFFDEDVSLVPALDRDLRLQTGDNINMSKIKSQISDLRSSYRARYQKFQATVPNLSSRQDCVLGPTSLTNSEPNYFSFDVSAAAGTAPFPHSVGSKSVSNGDFGSTCCINDEASGSLCHDAAEHSLTSSFTSVKRGAQCLPKKEILGEDKGQVCCRLRLEGHEYSAVNERKSRLRRHLEDKENCYGFGN